jgi:hypothetical protein
VQISKGVLGWVLQHLILPLARPVAALTSLGANHRNRPARPLSNGANSKKMELNTFGIGGIREANKPPFFVSAAVLMASAAPDAGADGDDGADGASVRPPLALPYSLPTALGRHQPRQSPQAPTPSLCLCPHERIWRFRCVPATPTPSP